MPVNLINADQKRPDGQVKTTLLGKVEIAVRLGLKPWSSDVSLAQLTPF